MYANNNELMTLSDFTQSLEKLKPRLSLLETEESWEQILGSLEKLEGLCRLGACEYTSELVSFIRSVHRSITNAMNSERTRLSGAALDVLHTLASSLNMDFEPLIPLFLPGLLLLCGRTNKVVISRAKSCILSMIEMTQLPGILSHLAHFAKDKSPTIRLVVAEGTLSSLKCFNPPDLEKETHSRDVENIIRSAARDANADVRKTGKDVFQSYKVLLPHRVNSFTAPLTPTIRKYLQLGNVKAQDKDTAVPLTKRNPASQSIHSQQASSKSDIAARPAHSTTISSIASKPSTLTRSLAPLRPIQISAKRGEPPTAGAPNQRKPPVVMPRPFALPAANATGPQRVIKQTAPTEGQRLILEGKAIKLVSTGRSCPVRSDKPSHMKAGSTTSLAHLPPTRSVKPTRQPSTSRPLPTAHSVADDPGRVTVGQRDLTRPTLSQMARVKPPVTRPTSKSVQGLNIRKTKSPVNPGPAVKSHPSRAAGMQASRVTTGSTNSTRPATPASIPLPPSPKLPSARAEELKPTDENQSSENDDVQPEVVINHEDDIQQVNSDDHTVTTPLALGVPPANFNGSCKTPISALLMSIQQGFNLTPCSPLSPPQHYSSSDSAHEPGTFRLGVITQHD